jgi:subtilisin family serine protease
MTAPRPDRTSDRRPCRLHVERLEDRLTPSTPAGDVPGQLLVRFQSGVTRTQIADFYAANHLTELRSYDTNPVDGDEGLRLVATPTPAARDLIPVLQLNPRVRYAEPNIVLTSGQVPNDPSVSRDWGLRNTGQTAGTPDADIDADEAWDVATGSSSVIVAVIDTGVDYTHPDLAANMWHNPGEVAGNGLDDDANGFVDDYYGYDFVNEDSDPMDDNRHGTHVAGTIGMDGNNAVGATGVNWDVKIMALKAGDANAQLTLDDLLQAYSYVTLMRGRGVNIRVTNHSYGGYNPFIQSWKDAMDAMGDAGVMSVVAAHNYASDNDQAVNGVRMYPASFDSPSIVSVAATDHNDRIASFSNWGATSVDLAAPGESVWSTVPGGYDWNSGTSMATPHVAGAAALVWSVYPNLSVAEVKARLLGGADYIGDVGANASYPTVTNGRLNVRNALIVPGADADTTAPAAVSNLAATTASPWSVTLTWAATGDDGVTGRAGFYDVRYSSAPITAANWAAAARAVGEPAPRPGGSPESFTVTGLEPGTLYYFAVKVKDNAGNVSAPSNVAVRNTTAATALVRDDVEGGAAGWAATGLWHRSGSRAHDSATAWYYGQEATRTYFTGGHHAGNLTLTSPIDLAGVGAALLRFREWRQVGDFLHLDVARVQVSRDSAAWTTLSESFFSTLDWQQRAIDLTPFVGGPLYVRFSFDTNAFGFFPWAITQGYAGWYVDDVEVLVPGAQPAGFSVSDATVTEGDGGTVDAVFTVTRSSGTGPASVHYATAAGSATAAGGDYLGESGTLSFAPGETRKTVTVRVTGDRVGEADEHFTLLLSNPTGAAIADGSGAGTILDDEPRVGVTGLAIFPEGNKNQVIHVAVNLTAPSDQVVRVDYATADGTATAPKDYRSVAGTLTFQPGETRKSIAITLPNDEKAEAMVEAFHVNLSNATTNAVVLRQGVVHIVDDGSPKNGGGNGSAAVAGDGFHDLGGSRRLSGAADSRSTAAGRVGNSSRPTPGGPALAAGRAIWFGVDLAPVPAGAPGEEHREGDALARALAFGTRLGRDRAGDEPVWPHASGGHITLSGVYVGGDAALFSPTSSDDDPAGSSGGWLER